VITGFNTDVQYEGVTYHIQTEDKGIDTPIILSLVYDRGTILAAKREPYDDLIEKGFDEKQLTERLNKQHKTICAAIKKGRIEEIKKLSKQKKTGLPAINPTAAPDLLEVAPAASPKITLDVERSLSFEPFHDLPSPIPMPTAPVTFAKRPAVHVSIPVVEAVAVVDIPEPLPFDAVRIVSDLAGMERVETNKLSLDFIGGDAFFGGEKTYVTVMVCRGTSRKVIGGAEVMVKVLGSSFRPLIFHSQTDKNGISTVVIDIPTFNTGRASILVRAINKGEEVEVRRPIIHG
jgi:hypothetical protein